MQRKTDMGTYDNSKKAVPIAVYIFLFGIAIALRYFSLLYTNRDLIGYENWYDRILVLGFPRSLAGEFSIYTPPYTYLLTLVTFSRNFLPKLIAIKLIPIGFDLINAIIIYNIIRVKHAQNIALFASLIFLLAPTIVINSALWGQIDSIYTTFILLSIYYILTGRSVWAVLFFGVSFSIKAQAVFLTPLLFLLTLKKRIPWQSYLLIPLVYFVMMLPAIFAGRPMVDTFFVYLHQAGEFRLLSMNAPNWYVFFPESAYNILALPGLIFSGSLLAIWVYLSARRNIELTTDQILFLALVSVALVPFITPKMHDRYFYLADVLSIILAFYILDMWIVPIAYQAVSLLSYMPFLFALPAGILLSSAVIINTFVIGFLLWKQSVMINGKAETTSIESST